MKLLILLFVITSYSYSEEPLREIKEIPLIGNSLYYQGQQVYFKTIKPLIEGESQNKYNTYEIIEIEEQRRKDEAEALALNELEIKNGKYWVDGRWIERKNSNYQRINGGWFYKEK